MVRTSLLEGIRRQYEEERKQLLDQIKKLIGRLEEEGKLPKNEWEAQERFNRAFNSLMERKGLNISDISVSADISRTYLWQVTIQRTAISFENALRIAKALGTTVYDLITIEW